MINRLKKMVFQLQVKWLIIFKPSVLFEKINQLGWYKKTLRQWIDDQHFVAKSRVLEIGCASGDLTAYIAKLAHIPTGVDFSSEMIDRAKVKNNSIDFLVADVLDLPFETIFFDAVITASLINIVDNKSKAVNELYRTCKKGGVITALVPLATFNNEDLRSLQASVSCSGFSFAAMEAWHKLAPKMKASDVLCLFEQAGLTKITTKTYLLGMVISVSGIKPL